MDLIPLLNGGYPTYIVAMVLFPKIFDGKRSTTTNFEEGQLVHLILNKGDLRLQSL